MVVAARSKTPKQTVSFRRNCLEFTCWLLNEIETLNLILPSRKLSQILRVDPVEPHQLIIDLLDDNNSRPHDQPDYRENENCKSEQAQHRIIIRDRKNRHDDSNCQK